MLNLIVLVLRYKYYTNTDICMPSPDFTATKTLTCKDIFCDIPSVSGIHHVNMEQTYIQSKSLRLSPSAFKFLVRGLFILDKPRPCCDVSLLYCYEIINCLIALTFGITPGPTLYLQFSGTGQWILKGIQ